MAGYQQTAPHSLFRLATTHLRSAAVSRRREGRRWTVGSQVSWRIAIHLHATLQNSHQNGGRVFLIFVADPRTIRSCRKKPRDASGGETGAVSNRLLPTETDLLSR